MTIRRTYIAGMMLKAYRQICKISMDEFAKNSHISKSSITKLEGIASNSPDSIEQFSYCPISLNLCEKIASGMDMLLYEFLEFLEQFEKERDEIIDVVIYLEISKFILKKQQPMVSFK